MQFLFKEVPWRLIEEWLKLCVYDLVAHRFGGLKDLIFRYEWIPATSMFFTFNGVANGIKRKLRIKDELCFDKRKSLVIFSAFAIE